MRIALALLSCINAPISWKKAQLGESITWCGDFSCETIHLAEAKLAKLREQLNQLLRSKKVVRKKLDAVLSLLMWATCTCQHLRPYLAPLYKDLRSAAGMLKLIHPQLWQARVICAGSSNIACKADLPRVPAAQAWIRIADPLRTEVHLTSDSKSAIRWLQQCFAPIAPTATAPSAAVLRGSGRHGRRQPSWHRRLDSHRTALRLVRRTLDG